MPVTRQFRAGLLALTFLTPMAATAPAAATDVRAWDHGDYGRLVFDWGRPVGYRLDLASDRIVIGFDRPIDAPLGNVTARLGAYVRQVDLADDGKELALALRRPVTVKDFVLGSRIVLDLSSAHAPASTTEARQQPSAGGNAPSAAARDVPPVMMRGGRHPGFTRLVFEWPGPVGYRVERDGDRVNVAFDRAGAARLAGLKLADLENVAAIDPVDGPDGLVVALTVPEGARMRHYADGGKVVLDILNVVMAPVAPRLPAARSMPLAVDGDRQLAEVSEPLPEPLEAAAEADAAVDGVADPGTDMAAVAAVEASADRPPAPAAPVEETGTGEGNGSGAGEHAGPGTTASPAVPDRPDLPELSPTPAPPAVPVPTVEVADEPTSAEEPLRLKASLDPGFPSHAAVFERAGYLWIVFAASNRLDASALAAQAGALGEVEIVDAEGGVALRMPLPTNRVPGVSRESSNWSVTLSADAPPPSRPLGIVPQPDYAMGPRVLIEAPGARGLVRIVDPEVGDVLIVAPLPDAGMGVATERNFAQVAVLPSAQGAVIQPTAEDITVRIDREGVEVTAAEGLLLSSAVDRRAGAALPLPPEIERYLNVEEWQAEPGEYNRTRQALMRRIVDASEQERPRARLELARLYFAHGLGAEALGPLRILAADDPLLESRPDFALLRGASRVMAGDLEGAEKDLTLPALANAPEAVLWLGAMAAAAGDWDRAATAFSQAGQLLGTEPPSLAPFLSLPAAVTAVETGDHELASRRLATLSEITGREADEWPAFAYLLGRISEANGNREEAVAAYRRAAGADDDQLYRTRAEMALLRLGREAGEITPLAAAERLEGLQYGWRGDPVQHELLIQLGDSYWQAGQYREALESWAEAIQNFPDQPASIALQEERAKRIEELFSTDALNTLSPIAAASLYEDFKALMPGGTVGDQVIRRLAERLVEVDLLERAGNLLQQLVDGRLVGMEKTETATRLAGIRLLDGKPEEALAALDESELGEDMAEELAFQRRLLRARALSELGRADDALELLAADEGQLADAAKLDIAWRAQNWRAAADALGRLVGAPPPPDEPISAEQAELVLNQAIALSLAQDRPGLDRLAGIFGPAMDASEHAHVFAVLTRPNAPLGRLVDLATVRREVSEVDLFQNFLTGYLGPERVLTN